MPQHIKKESAAFKRWNNLLDDRAALITGKCATFHDRTRHFYRVQ